MALVQHLLDGIEQRCALGAKPVLQCPVGAKKMSRQRAAPRVGRALVQLPDQVPADAPHLPRPPPPRQGRHPQPPQGARAHPPRRGLLRTAPPPHAHRRSGHRDRARPAHRLPPALAVAATLTEANLGAFAAPAACQRLLIAPNHDTTSAHAAERLRARCRSPQVSAAVIAPVGHDFNDDLLAHGREALAARIHHAAGRLHFANRETTPAPTTPSPASHQGRLP